MISYLRNFFSKNNFLKGSFLIAIVFIITRAPYYFFYSSINVSSDSASYIAAAFDIINSRHVLFDIRTPGYPLFISMIWIFAKSYYAIAFVQSMIALLSGIFLLKIINKYYSSVTILSSISIAAFLSSSFFVILETSFLTESLFISSMIFTCAFMISAMKRMKLTDWIYFSSFAAITIIIRPAGLFLAGVLLLLLFYFIVNKFKPNYYVALIMPFSFIILSLCSYNFATLNKFTITPFGEANLSGVTILFMEPSEKYSSKVNEAIKTTLDSIPTKDINYVRNNNSITGLYEKFKNNFYRQMNLTGNLLADNPGMKFTDIQPVLREISIDAIKKNPKIYLKFFICNFIYFFNNSRMTMSYFDELSKIYKRTVIEKKYIAELESGKWKQISSDKSDNDEVKVFYQSVMNERSNSDNYIISNDSVGLKETFAKKIYEYYEIFCDFVFRNVLWLVIFVMTFILSTYRTLKSGLKDKDAFIVFLIGIMFVSKALLVSSVESSLVRYSYTVEFAIFLSLPFLIILLKSKKVLFQKNINHNK